MTKPAVIKGANGINSGAFFAEYFALRIRKTAKTPLSIAAKAKVYKQKTSPKETASAIKSLASPMPIGTGRLNRETNTIIIIHSAAIIRPALMRNFPERAIIRTEQKSGI